jgi:hypothetical protein
VPFSSLLQVAEHLAPASLDHCWPAAPTGVSLAESTGSPRFLVSHSVHAPLSAPGGISTPGLGGVSMLPSAVLTASASPTNPLSGLNHAACTIAVYASQAGLPQRHARLAADWWPAFAGQDFHLLD